MKRYSVLVDPAQGFQGEMTKDRAKMAEEYITVEANHPGDEKTAEALEKVINHVISKIDLERMVQASVKNYMDDVIAKNTMDRRFCALIKEVSNAAAAAPEG